MNSIAKNIIANIGSFLSYSDLKFKKDLPPFLPFYHLVSDHKLEYINSYIVRSKKQFEDELDFLLQKYQAVGLEEIVHDPGKNKMHLTFDDGLVECYSIIAPVLKKKGIPATFFISSDFVDNGKMFHRFKQAILESNGVIEKSKRNFSIHQNQLLDQLAVDNGIDFNNYKPYMSTEQVQRLVDDGFTVGGHSVDHPEMYLLSEDEQYQQVAKSMKWVVDNFDPTIKAFSFPFTDDQIKKPVFERIKQDGLIDVTFGTAGLKYDSISFNMQRVPVESNQNWSIKKVVHFEYFYYFVRSLFHKNTVSR